MLLYGINFLRGRNIFTTSRQYYAVFSNIGGLQKSSLVSVNGYNLGTVTDIQFHRGNINNIVVEISIERRFQLPKNSVIEIYSTDFMGSKAVNIILGQSNEFAKESDTLNSTFGGDLNTLVSKKLLPLKDKAENLIVSIDSVMGIIRNTFTPETQRDLKLAISSLRDLIETEKFKISSVLDHLNSFAQNLENTNKSFSNTIDNLSSITDSLDAANLKGTISQAQAALKQANEVLGKINSGQGTLGKLVNNDSLYNELVKTSKDLDILLIDINQNPNRYVHLSLFGSSGKKKK
jgi:phospholipid/cholesterol/gamma-HCH transport system substrate-binding protein